MSSVFYLVSACPGDRVPGHELADPECPEIPGLFERPEVQAWFESMGYGPDDPNELVYMVSEEDADEIPDGFEFLTVTR